MASRPEPWTEEQAKTVKDMLTCFNGPEEVCAAMECKRSDLNWLCRQAYGESFAATMERFHTVGRSLLRRAIFNAALEGNAKAVDTLAREQLGTGPVETRRRQAAKAKAEQAKAEEVDF